MHDRSNSVCYNKTTRRIHIFLTLISDKYPLNHVGSVSTEMPAAPALAYFRPWVMSEHFSIRNRAWQFGQRKSRKWQRFLPALQQQCPEQCLPCWGMRASLQQPQQLLWQHPLHELHIHHVNTVIPKSSHAMAEGTTAWARHLAIQDCIKNRPRIFHEARRYLDFFFSCSRQPRWKHWHVSPIEKVVNSRRRREGKSIAGNSLLAASNCDLSSSKDTWKPHQYD